MRRLLILGLLLVIIVSSSCDINRSEEVVQQSDVGSPTLTADGDANTAESDPRTEVGTPVSPLQPNQPAAATPTPTSASASDATIITPPEVHDVLNRGAGGRIEFEANSVLVKFDERTTQALNAEIASSFSVKFRDSMATQMSAQRQSDEPVEWNFSAMIVESMTLDRDQIRPAMPDLADFGIGELQPLLAPVVAANTSTVAQQIQAEAQMAGTVDDEPTMTMQALRDQTVQTLQAENIKIANAQKTAEVFVARLDAAQQSSPEAAVAALMTNPQVELAELNYIARITDPPTRPAADFIPNDEYYDAYQWNLPMIQMPKAWEAASGQMTTVAVLDTGIATVAPDFRNDTFRPGYNFFYPGIVALDDNGHGTHVAGTIAQATNNQLGTAGVAFNSYLIPVKVLDRIGQGSFDNIIQGIHYAVNQGADVINMSFAAPVGSQLLKEALDYARAQGVVLVAAAGNESGPVGYPACYNTVISVGAVDIQENIAYYSNTGTGCERAEYGAAYDPDSDVDLVAPGGDTAQDLNSDGFGDGILQQTFKPEDVVLNADGTVQRYNNFRYLFMQGTSMAAPHVSGVAALLRSRSPNLNHNQVRDALKASAKQLGPDVVYGAGLLQACDALARIGAPCDNGNPPTATPMPTVTNTPVPGVTATPDPGTTPTPITPTPPPGSGSELINNGGFEANSGWVFPRTPAQGSYSSDVVRSGSRSARVGIVPPMPKRYSYSSVVQKVTIPADARKATLTAYVYPMGDPGMWNADSQLVLVLNRWFRTTETLSQSLSNSRTWQPLTFDLTHYAGETIHVYFGATNLTYRAGATAMYVDDVSLIVER